MSPILVRPVREQLEHDRVIRLLQAKYKRKFEVAINPGNQQVMPVGTGPSPWYPDLVLQSPERSRKLLGVVEVETTESVNHLEAMSEWAALSKIRAPLHLYIPGACIDSARRLATEHSIKVAELWAYHVIGDQIRFTLVQRSEAAERAATRAAAAEPRPAKPAAEPAMARPAPTRAAVAAPRPAASARPGNGRAAGTNSRRPAVNTAARRKPAAKAKAAAPRRPAAAVKSAAGRKSTAASRTQKRR